jgi:beta-glucosidase
VDGAAAIFQTYLPGDYGGTALADLLFGDENPSGKLPYTYPKYDGVIEFYDHPKSVDRSGKTYGFDAFDPEWEFGFGLSYTDFSYSNLRLDQTSIETDGSVKVTVDVTNSGPRQGKEVVQLYVSDKKASIVPAGKRLVDFKKLDLAPNETQSVEFMISLADLMFADQNGSMMYELGTFMVEINGDTLEFELK